MVGEGALRGRTSRIPKPVVDAEIPTRLPKFLVPASGIGREDRVAGKNGGDEGKGRDQAVLGRGFHGDSAGSNIQTELVSMLDVNFHKN